MSESQASSESAPPSAEVEKERVDRLHEQTNLGAGNREPDPATSENPPSDLSAGDEVRGGESTASQSDRLDTGVSREQNIHPQSPTTHPGDQGG